jgi:uncharacterized protein (TIGR03382 family)
MPTQTFLAAALACAAVSSAAVVAQAADIYVNPGETLASALRRANPGDRVLARAGRYPGGGWIDKRGTASAPITILSVDGPRRAVIEGGGETIRIGDASAYLIFDGFEIRNGGDNLIHVDGGSHHITFRNIYAHDAGFNGDVFKANQSHHLVVERSEFARPGARNDPYNPYQECLDFVDVDDSVIRDNFFHDGGSMLLFVKGGSRNTVIERNVFSHQRAGASDPMVGLGGPTDPWLLGGEKYEVINVVFRNNVLMNGVQGGVGVYDAQGAYIANNLFLNNDRVLVEFRAGNGPAGGSTDVRVVNNLFVDSRGRMPTPYQRSSHSLSNFTTSHNLFWNNGGGLPSTSLLDLRSQPGHLAADPRVGVPAAQAGRDSILSATRPPPSSPAADSALDVAGAPFRVTDDIRRVSRTGRLDRGPFVLDPDRQPSDPGPPGPDPGDDDGEYPTPDPGDDGESPSRGGGCNAGGLAGSGTALPLLALGVIGSVLRRRRRRAPSAGGHEGSEHLAR